MSSIPRFVDRVMESSTTTGTGTYTLAGAVTGFQSFSAVGNGNSCYYCAMAVDASGIPNGGWEVGKGTYTSSGTTLSRDVVFSSSNSNNAVNWGAGTRRIFLVAPARQIGAALGCNVLEYGAVGDYNSSNDTGTDDTTAITNAIADANSAGGCGRVIFPSRRAYKITSTIAIPNGVMLEGLGFQQPGGTSGSPAKIVWRGTSGGTMFTIGTGTGGNYSNPIRNLFLVGGQDLTTISSWAGCALDFQNGVDNGTVLDNVWIFYIDGNGIQFNSSTNSYLIGCRFDRISGYAIYADLTNGNHNQQIFACEYDNWDDSMGSPYSSGFLFLDGESESGFTSKVLLSACHLEVNGPLIDTYASGSVQADQSGIIRLGVVGSGANLQHIVEAQDLTMSPASAVTSHSVFQVTSSAGTLAQHASKICIRLTNGRTVARQPGAADAATGVVKLLSNVPAAYEYQHPTRMNVAEFIRYGGPVDSERGVIDIYGATAPGYGTLNLRPTTVANLPSAGYREGDLAYVTDSTVTTGYAVGGGSHKVFVMLDGSDWKIMFALS